MCSKATSRCCWPIRTTCSNIPGRKTDQNDSEWIADLLAHGLLQASFVPARPIQELRDLTRYRVKLTGEFNRVHNRIAKVLEDANIKLGSVASDILGATGRLIIRALIAGEQRPEWLADKAVSFAAQQARGIAPGAAGRCE